MRQLEVWLVFSLTLIYFNLRGPNKYIKYKKSGLRLIANQQKGFNTLTPFFKILVIFPVAGVPAFDILGCLTRLGETAFLGWVV